MNVLIFSNSTKLLEKWKNALSSFHVKKIESIELLQDKISEEVSVVLIDIFSCGENPISFLAPIINAGAFVMVLDPYPKYENTKNFLELGVKGYGNLMIHDMHLNAAVETIIDGDIWLYPDFINELLFRMGSKPSPISEGGFLEKLSYREREVALCIKDGSTNQEIAEKLDITTRTVKSHVSHIYEKIGVANRLSLALLFNK